MCDIRLFRSAYTEFELAREIYRIPRNDEAFLNGVAYHLQQSTEKLLKAFLECKGVTVPNTHDIYKLVRMSRDNGSNIHLTAWIEDRADTLTRWEMDTRYNMDYSVEAEKVKEGIEEIQRFFEANGIKEELRAELKGEETKEILRSFFPKNFRPADDFEWNCYYQIYRKKIEK
ncbi:HEPN domain-containing protein [Lachnospiraceae bacterium WCA-9-b2]|uniref:HEPN domain-containing protein n=1 Tax=Sporofaciens musculi TaxID=2681861 RepID=A0A7X3MJJ2_9FIRM|nr:HEPN domain-containing protein [Sporofaciens musculi]MCI9421632.1 HEPN domain-containing protein [Dorea sp.]MXP77599.1 HEPN domain-containing protein [Sporofaciens musculi]